MRSPGLSWRHLIFRRIPPQPEPGIPQPRKGPLPRARLRQNRAMPESQDPHRLSRWPADPSLLTDTTVCPSCFFPLGRTVCANCGLDLGVSAAGDLLAAGTAVATAETARQRLLSRMRAEQEQRLLADRMAASAPPVSSAVHDH